MAGRTSGTSEESANPGEGKAVDMPWTGFGTHPDAAVNQAILRLAGALCIWERDTSRTSMVVIRDSGGFVCRLMDGKPVPCDEALDDAAFLALLQVEDPYLESK